MTRKEVPVGTIILTEKETNRGIRVLAMAKIADDISNYNKKVNATVEYLKTREVYWQALEKKYEVEDIRKLYNIKFLYKGDGEKLADDFDGIVLIPVVQEGKIDEKT